MNDLVTLRSRLAQAGRGLSDALRAELVGAPRDLDESLLALLGDESLLRADAIGGGYVPLHAMHILAARGAHAAIPRLIALLLEADPIELVFDHSIRALRAFGPAAVEPCVAALEGADDESHGRLTDVLAGLGVRDDRILSAVIQHVEREPQLGAGGAAGYGDTSALPALTRALDAYQVKGDGPFADYVVNELAAAIEDLGGTLTTAQAEKRAAVQQLRRTALELDAAAAAPHRAPPRPGRNEPCHCGSGRKYKKCHLAADERARLDAAVLDALDETLDE